MLKPLTSFLAMLLLVGCAAAPETAPAPAVDPATQEEAIRQLDRSFARLMEEGNVEGLVNLYTPEGRIMPQNAPTVQGREAITEYVRQLVALPNLSVQVEPTEIVVSDDGQVAYDIGTYTMAFDGPEGRVQDRGKYLVAWRKVDGEWKIAADMFSSDLPAH